MCIPINEDPPSVTPFVPRPVSANDSNHVQAAPSLRAVPKICRWAKNAKKAAYMVFLLLIVIPLALLLLFLAPIEFIISSWHLQQVQATTSGIVSRSQIATHRGSSRSVIEYSYRIDGQDYTSTRVRAGIVSNRDFETGGGEFSRKHPTGSTVQVHYDPNRPTFAIVDFGWPKWSVGFSLGV